MSVAPRVDPDADPSTSPPPGEDSGPDLVRRPGEILQALVALSSIRATAESKVASSLIERTAAAEKAYLDARSRATTRRDARAAEVESARAGSLAAAQSAAKSARAEADSTFEQARKRAIGRSNAEVNAAKKTAEEQRWQALTVCDAARSDARGKLDLLKRLLAARDEQLAPIREAAEGTFARLAPFAPADSPPAAEVPGSPGPVEAAEVEPEALSGRIEAADARLAKLEGLGLPTLVSWGRYVPLMVVVTAALAGGLGLALGWAVGASIGVVAGLGLAAGLRGVLIKAAQTQVAADYHPLQRELDEIASAVSAARQSGLLAHAERDQAAVARRDREVEAFEQKKNGLVAESQGRRDALLSEAKAAHARATAEAESALDAATKAAEADHGRDSASNAAEADQALARADRAYHETRQAVESTHDRDWSAMAERWRSEIGRVKHESRSLNRLAARLSPDRAPTPWRPMDDVPPVVRVGEFQIPMSTIPGGVPRDDTLRPEAPEVVALPAMIPFPDLGCLMVKAAGPAREHAARVLQSAMLRLLLTVPPSKVRLTIYDPVGLGRNFAAFMHLADFDEALVSSRIWTEPAHVERKLNDLTEVMENVIQKYLRNEFETIREYNAQAGEVAEPYRVLVVCDYPHGFTEAAARRLASIVDSGPRCGVSVMMTVDTAEPLPGGIKLADLERHAAVVQWASREGRFIWRGGPLEPFPLSLDEPPEPSKAIDLLKQVGEAAKKANRVEVPFEVIAPAEGDYWKGDSRGGIDVPLGRAGANRLQHLMLGKGTSQHVLIAGRTGSGKSTLLHALITNLALTYDPDEVHLYLIDFKKGVEFKTYATHELPHARVIAVESEREFGVSVLQKLDDEMKVRGDLYRAAGAQDVASYRKNTGASLPRLLLIIDEFQEFFVEDDKVSQEAALLLDRLVRQGRAFGIHLHMGSQTLAGAYSLARSTLGQMGIRVALQCSESDAHLILSEDNAAARLLSRPGEAIYNDANGMVEGNHIFQVVWLGDDRRERYLKQLHAMAAERHLLPTTPAIVFEGNVSADIDRNPTLHELRNAPTWPDGEVRAPRAFLGEAVAIKEPTAAVFRPQGGSHALIVGQNEEAAVAMTTAAVLGLAAQLDPSSARFYVGDASPVDSPFAGKVGRLGATIPHPIRVFGPREIGAVMAEIGDEVARRQESGGESGPPIFLFLHDLARFRDLRKQEDDFGSFGKFGGDEKPANPSKILGTILRDGPTLGVHVVAWCDSMNNLNRTLERSDLREFEMRILFQMSQSDSSNLIDTPVASKLGPHRAYYHSEEQGTLEKFRPYGIPTDDWLAEFGRTLKGRVGPPGVAEA